MIAGIKAVIGDKRYWFPFPLGGPEVFSRGDVASTVRSVLMLQAEKCQRAVISVEIEPDNRHLWEKLSRMTYDLYLKFSHSTPHGLTREIDK